MSTEIDFKQIIFRMLENLYLCSNTQNVTLKELILSLKNKSSILYNTFLDLELKNYDYKTMKELLNSSQLNPDLSLVQLCKYITYSDLQSFTDYLESNPCSVVNKIENNDHKAMHFWFSYNLSEDVREFSLFREPYDKLKKLINELDELAKTENYDKLNNLISEIKRFFI